MEPTVSLQLHSILPPLRQEIQLVPGPRDQQGAPTWTLHDPASNRFFRLGWREFQLLANWYKSVVADILAGTNQVLPGKVSVVDVEKLFTFLQQNELLKITHQGAFQLFDERYQRIKKSWHSWLAQHYLFLRIPLLRPDRFLTKTYPHIRFLFSKVWLWCVLLLSALGLFLITRQLDTFLHTFSYLFSFQGAVIFMISLCVVKIAHEFGHAYACKHYGVRVPTMGVAFMVFWPVLYTDATEAWKLTNKQSRATIAIAGVMTELAIAGIAAFCWSFLPQGVFKTVTFIIATTSWIFSLAVNLNPFMRFDGYYLVADYFDIPNLQPRAFALARWWLRERLLGIGFEPPELFSSRKQFWLILYAFGTWLYRLVLFLGIAVLVYNLAFKALGILLFIIEIYYLIFTPIFREVAVWWKYKADISVWRKCLWLLFFAVIVVFFIIPWQVHIDVPAIIRAKQYQYLFPSSAAQIAKVNVQVGNRVEAGDTLFELYSPSLNYQLALAEARYQAFQLALDRRATTVEMIDTVPIIAKQLAEIKNKITGLEAELANLVIKSTFAGEVMSVTTGLTQNRWVNPKQQLALLVNNNSRFVEAYVKEKDLPLVKVGSMGEFYPEDPDWPSFKCRVTEIELIHSAQLQQPYLASIYGGDIAVRKGNNGKLNSEQALFKVRLQVSEDIPVLRQVIRGTVVIETQSYSIIYSLFSSVLQVLIRETQF
ncbi:site-2 protease family protein [Spartinivicinus ruber]|uniref:site-2 protease family protein n=1 Tax=Spartinivicinus ruber TaxID=2683272 RepID=UPI0013D72F05|nr:site-2 protease family protein [Spartinivicinus ruber]